MTNSALKEAIDYIDTYEKLKTMDEGHVKTKTALLQYAKKDRYLKVTGNNIELSKYALSQKDKGVK